jgi:hypothetical protein
VEQRARHDAHQARNDVFDAYAEQARELLDRGGVMLIDVGEEWQLRQRNKSRRRQQPALPTRHQS